MNMNSTITVNECRKLREITHILTQGCFITKSEYEELMVLYYKILGRIESEEKQNAKKL